MEVKVELDRDIIFLKLSGGLVASTLEQLRNQIQKLVDKKYVNIVFDMSRVDFVDSSGLGLCISTARELAAISGKLVCCGLSDNVQKLFKMTRADQKVAVMASRMNAFEYMLSRLNDDPHGASVLHE
ncbi:MAG TPA: STAS domain-containing protein [Geobacteraceae bacterium]|nr:STAS domain-containing protein [Geobacteraceae bacterium]